LAANQLAWLCRANTLTNSNNDRAIGDAHPEMAGPGDCHYVFALCRPVHSHGLEEMNMVSTRARDVAEVLWELKRAEKVATFSTIADRAGFRAGSNGRAIISALRTVRRDWPHLQWWRAINDSGVLEKGSEQATELRQAGYELLTTDGDGDGVNVTLAEFRTHLMVWTKGAEELPEATA
jgi:alkylated DNA nucleotide flippase Atl1